MAGQRVTIRDVARAAGLSVTTVSDGLRGRGRLPEPTRQRVRLVAAELGYVANPGAQNLRRGRTGTIGLYFPRHSINLQYYLDLAIGAAEQALTDELGLTLIPAPRDASALKRLAIDGVIVSDPTLGDPILAELRQLRVPMVTCERDLEPGAAAAGVVESDHRAGMRQLLAHLRGQGVSDVALICPPVDSSFPLDVRQAYLAWCAEHDVAPVVEEVPFVPAAALVQAAVHRLLASARPPRAIVSVPDGGATAAVHAVREMGRRVPEDQLIAAYVDRPELAGLPVPVTAVDLNPRRMGRDAARLLADLLEGRAQFGTRQALPIELRVRASTLTTAQASGDGWPRGRR